MTCTLTNSKAWLLNYHQAQLPKHLRNAGVYGNLGPEVRRVEAERFRSGEAQVIVATDAIAYGLNLPIKNVYFSACQKRINGYPRRLPTALVHQIAGRSGRFGLHEEGFVGALDNYVLVIVRDALKIEPPVVTFPLPVRPSFVNLMAIQQIVPNAGGVAQLLELFRKYVRFDSSLFKNEALGDMVELARIADEYPHLSMKDRFTLANAPVDTEHYELMSQFRELVRAIGEGATASPPPLPKEVASGATDDSEILLEAETWMKGYDLYAWLAYHFPDHFPKMDTVSIWRAELNKFICLSLRRGIILRCRTCRNELPPHHVHPNCDSCFRAQNPYWDDAEYDYEDEGVEFDDYEDELDD